jgi:hypothetical protein
MNCENKWYEGDTVVQCANKARYKLTREALIKYVLYPDPNNIPNVPEVQFLCDPCSFPWEEEVIPLD